MLPAPPDCAFAERAARAALALARVPAAEQARIVAAVVRRLDPAEAMARRDEAIRDAHRLLGYPVLLVKALHQFHARIWPNLCHLPAPPEDATPLDRAFFLACRACADGGVEMPGERQIRRILARREVLT